MGDESIIYDGYLYQRVFISQRGDITYRCISRGSCKASIVTDSKGVYLRKQMTTHSDKCNKRRAKSKETTPGNVRILLLTAQQKKKSNTDTQESTMGFIYSETKKGNQSIIYDGFVYRKHNVLVNGNINYICINGRYKCRAIIVMEADDITVVEMRTSHQWKCYSTRLSELHVACEKNADERCEKGKAKTRRKLSVKKQTDDTHPSKSFPGNTANQAPVAASKSPASVTTAVILVSSPSVVSRQHEDDEIPMAIETFNPAMPAPQVVIETEEAVSSTSYEEPEELELNPADGIRQMKAKAEAQMFSHMQNELVKLDNSLAVDVTLIRDSIENASRELTEAQKQYNKAEKDFNDAKRKLQQKSELKEQLTEYLNTVIHQNGVRKACKRKKFMPEQGIEFPSFDAVPLTSCWRLSSFDIHDVNTFHSPLTSPESSTTSSTSRIPFTPYSQSTNKPASSLLQSASSGTQQLYIVPQLTSSNPQPSSSVLEPDSSVPYPVSLSVAPQVAIRQEYLTTVNRMDTESPISIHSDTNWEDNSDIESPVGL